MELLRDPDIARDYVKKLQASGESVAVVPTMGALHEGHLSLVRIAKERFGRAITTIFVNPTQFAPDEDLDKYPRTLEQDLEKLRGIDTDAVFVPDVNTMYPAGCTTSILPPDVANVLEGEFRPEHFGGVCTIVLKLFQCLPCDAAIFGRKDYQQWRVIEAMVEDLNLPIQIVAGEIIRDPDGLAMSSRNRYLSETDRLKAVAIPRSLQELRADIEVGVRDVGELQFRLSNRLRGVPLGRDDRISGGVVIESSQRQSESAGQPGVDTIDYAVIVDSKTLQPITRLNQPAVALVAARVGSTRLIDNLLIDPKF